MELCGPGSRPIKMKPDLWVEKTPSEQFVFNKVTDCNGRRGGLLPKTSKTSRNNSKICNFPGKGRWGGKRGAGGGQSWLRYGACFPMGVIG